ncbi:PLD [Symbiodinium natans]|uniref:phospholipase D n=1 Tax=Symbiodinium natans TaxID=878477 RepID=A0A812VFH2_9DINO|nr:PLD [Symbiodinium natans]
MMVSPERPSWPVRYALALFGVCAADAFRHVDLSDDSFVPERHSFEWLPCEAQPVHCGQDYFHEVYMNFQTAEEIIVMGWWTMIDSPIFSPEFGRPPNMTMRELVKSAAERGAIIYYLFWQTALSEKMGYPVEEPAAQLRALHPNVKTLVDTSRDMVTVLWSAHIKVAVFDRRLAYAGGIDFANSRLDSPRHQLPDEARTPAPENLQHGQHGYSKPWEDMMIKLTGEAAEDLATVAVERWWTYCESLMLPQATGQCRDKNKPPLTSLGTLSVKLISKEEGTNEVELTVDGGYSPLVRKLKAVGQAAVLDLGSRRDMSKRATLKMFVDDREGRLFANRPPVTSAAVAGDACSSSVGGGIQATGMFSKACTCKALAYVAGQNPACETAKMNNQYDPMKLLGKGCFCQQVSQTWPLLDFRTDAPQQVSLAGATLQISHSRGKLLDASAANKCRLLLQGSHMWLGTSQVVADIYQVHRDMIAKASRSVYIENQYFGSRLSSAEEAMSERCQSLQSSAENDLAHLLFHKITTKAQRGEKFSAVIVFPLATEESETQYPNLRTAQCMQEALVEFWARNHISAPLSEYFGMYHLANVVSVNSTSSAFYGIFVHSKLVAIDYDTEGAEAIVGSANLNDRSLLGDRDAEVSVAVRGPFVQAMMSILLQSHAASSLPSAVDLQPHLSEVAEANAERLKDIGMDWAKGTLGSKQLLDQNIRAPLARADPVLDTAEAFMVGAGVHWKLVPGQLQQELRGQLLPWNVALWGDADVYRSWKHFHPTGAWLQTS